MSFISTSSAHIPVELCTYPVRDACAASSAESTAKCGDMVEVVELIVVPLIAEDIFEATLEKNNDIETVMLLNCARCPMSSISIALGSRASKVWDCTARCVSMVKEGWLNIGMCGFLVVLKLNVCRTEV